MTARHDTKTGDVVFVDKAEVVIGRITHGWIEDSKIDPRTGQGAISDGIHYSLVPWNGGQAVVMHIDRAFISDPARVFPIDVDPTTTTELAASDDTYVTSGFTANSAGDTALKVGTWDNGAHVRASYVRFPGVASLNPNVRLLNAQFGVFNNHSWSCDLRGLGVYPVTQAWLGTTMTNWPGATYDTNNKVLWAPFAMGAPGCGANWAFWDSFAVPAFQSLVEGWIKGTVPNFGLTLRVDPGSENDNYAYKHFGSSETGLAGPYLRITYSPYDVAYTVNPSGQAPTNTAGGWQSITLQNTGTVCWPANGITRLSYHLHDAANNQISFEHSRTLLPSQVCPGQSITVNGIVDPAPPGSYILQWDMVNEGVSWFSANEAVPMHPQTLLVANVAPNINSVTPLNNPAHNSQTVTLSMSASDADAWPAGGSLSYLFKMCDGLDTDTGQLLGSCVDSGWTASSSWGAPTTMDWNRPYYWQARVRDTALAENYTSPLVITPKIGQPNPGIHLGLDAYSALTHGVSLNVGNFIQPETDVVVAQVGPALQVDRVYNSLDASTGPLGDGWGFNFGSRLVVESGGTILLTYADGKQGRFAPNGDGTYNSPFGYFTKVMSSSGNYILLDKDGTRRTYNSTGRMISIAAANGIVQNLTYDGSGKLTAVVNPTPGRSLQFGWTGSHITSVTTDAPVSGGSGLVWNYAYSGDKLTSVCTPKPGGTNCTTYGYTNVSGRDMLTSVTRPRGNAVQQIHYAGDGTVDWRKDGRNKQWSFSSSVIGGVKTVTMTDPFSHQNKYVFDSQGRLTSIIDALNKTKTFLYNDAGSLVETADANQNRIELGVDIRGNTVRRTTNHHEQKFSAYYSYYFNSGNPADLRNDKMTESRDARSLSAGDNNYLTTTTYDTSGNVLTVTTPTTSDFPAGRTMTNAYTNGAESAVGSTGTMPAGLLRTVTDYGGKVVTYSYDNKGDLRRIVDPLLLQTDISYDNLGRKLTSTGVSDTYPSGLTTTWTYNEIGSVLTETLPTASNTLPSGARTPRTTYTYDANENVASIVVSDVGGLDATRTTTYEYDDNDRLIATHDPLSGTSSVTYNDVGNILSETSRGGVVTSYAYTDRDELAKTTIQNFVDDPTVPTAPRNLDVEQRFYDDGGRLIESVDALGRKTRNQYTKDDLLAAVVVLDFDNPDTSTRNITLEEYTYDGAGNVVQQISGGQVARATTFVYDKAGRLSSSTADPSGVNRETTFAYDGNNNVLRQTVSQPGSSSAEVQYTYNGGNLPLTQVVENGSTDLTTTTPMIAGAFKRRLLIRVELGSLPPPQMTN